MMQQVTRFLTLAATVVILMSSQAVYAQLSAKESLGIVIQKLAALNDTGELDRLISEGKREAAGTEVSAEKCLQLGLLLTGKAIFGKDLEDAKSSWREAIHYLEKAITLSPQLAEAHAVLGHLYLCPYVEDEQGFSKAKRHFGKALQLDPNQSVAKEGMRRIALRSSPVSEKERYFKENLDSLSRVTQSGRRFSILSVKIKDSPQGCDLIAALEVADVSRSNIVDSVEAMKYMGGVPGAKKPPSKPSKTISSIIRMVGEVTGMTYTGIQTLKLDLDRIAIVLHVPDEGPTHTIFIPVATFNQYAKKQISARQFSGTMTYTGE